MNEYIQAALYDYDIARAKLERFTRDNTDFELTIADAGYPIIFTFSPSEDAQQESIFEPDSNGAVGEIRVACSSSGIGVDMGIKCHVQAAVLKKLLGHCQACAEMRLHAYMAGSCE